MKSLIAFTKKELVARIRSFKLIILAAVFVFLGIMNPAVAKLTPALLEMLAPLMEGSGLQIGTVTVSALDSWVQFFKNAPMGLIVFIVLEGNTFTKEYGSGTLVLSLTKGLSRYKVVVAKAAVMQALWTVLYFLSFGITYLGNMLFWDNSVAKELMFSVVCWWLYGVFVIMLAVLFSAIGRSIASVLLGTGGVVMAFYLVSIIPKINKFLPTMLMDGNSLIYGILGADQYIASFVITLVLTVAAFAVSIPIFNKKQL